MNTSIGENHWLTNLGKVLLEMVEGDLGFYLGEDDILCFDNFYDGSQ